MEGSSGEGSRAEMSERGEVGGAAMEVERRRERVVKRENFIVMMLWYALRVGCGCDVTVLSRL